MKGPTYQDGLDTRKARVAAARARAAATRLAADSAIRALREAEQELTRWREKKVQP